jgi:tRNA(fMet)-specific endonuclease VapC
VFRRAIARAELLYGAARSQDPAKEQARVEVFRAPFASFPFDDAAADKYAEIRHNLERLGQRIGAHDLEI